MSPPDRSQSSALAVVLVALAAGLAHAEPLRLDEAVRLSLTSARLRAAREDVAQARAEARTAALAPNPTLLVETGGEGGPQEIVAELTYPIDWLVFRKRRAAVASADAAVGVAEAAQANLERLRVLETTWAFTDVLEAIALLEIAVETRRSLEQATAAVERAAASGGRPRIELARMRLELAAAQRDERGAGGAVIAAKAALRGLLGELAPRELEVAGELGVSLGEEVPDIEASLAVALENRPDLAALRRRIDQARGDELVARRAALPEMIVGVAVARPLGEEPATWAANLELTLPVLDRNQGERRRAAAVSAQRAGELEAALGELRAEVTQAVVALSTARANAAQLAATDLGLAAEVRDSLRAGYAAGGQSFLELLDAERSYRDTYQAHVTARADYHRARAAYEAAIGRKAAVTDATLDTSIAETPAERRRARLRLGLYIALTGGVLAYLLWPVARGAAAGAGPPISPAAAVRTDEAGVIHVDESSPLHAKLEVTRVAPDQIAAPVLTVTGAVVASLRPGRAGLRDWQFNSPELLATYTDWQKAVTDIGFAWTQLQSIRQLGQNRVAAQTEVVARLEKLVAAGTETEGALVTARAELLQAEIEGRKDLHEAETAWRLAQRTEASLARQLQQAGLAPELLRDACGEVNIVVADVPESLLSRVKLGQGCEARFAGLGERAFTGSVRAIAPVLSSERRSLRVLFTLADPEDLLRPGMFADIGLGTDAREALLVPLAGVIHVGRADYVLVRAGDGWRPARVEVGEAHEGVVEILSGLERDAEVIGRGAILLKPVVVELVKGARGQGRGG